MEEKHVPSQPGGEFPRDGIGKEFPADEHGKMGGESIEPRQPREREEDPETTI